MNRRHCLSLLAASGAGAFAQSHLPGLPNVGVKADTGPLRSESGVGTLLPWADYLWAVTYNSHTSTTGTGLGLHRIDDKLSIERVHLSNGTHANRFVHKQSNQAIIGPYIIDQNGNWKVLDQFLGQRLTATMKHLTDPANRVYMLTMEGLLYELDVATRKSALAADLVKEFQIGKRPHFKGGFTGQGRVVVANNGLYEFGENEAGLFEWDGKKWRALSRKPHMDCAGREDMGNVVFCTGWDESSVLLWALVKGQWKRYRLPKASHVYNHAWQTEWMRIREVETEHFLMDIHGMFYELQPIAFQDAIWGVKPICRHLRTIPDYCSFRGLLALGGNENTPNADNNTASGQPQSGIWFGKTDDLWQWGKPSGWGGPWRNASVRAGEPSDPFLMTGFDQKMVHLKAGGAMGFRVEIDFLGNGSWELYETVKTGPGGYGRHIFPPGFSAHWVRVVPLAAGTVSAEFFYT